MRICSQASRVSFSATATTPPQPVPVSLPFVSHSPTHTYTVGISSHVLALNSTGDSTVTLYSVETKS